MKKVILFAILAVILGCGRNGEVGTNSGVNLSPNKYPAVYGIDVEYCEGLGYTYQLRLEDGKEVGYCVFAK
ncbi:MAG: hypothetical protein ABIG95_02245, partial [Candidatus Woesearchaeota archaeon]